MITSIVNILMCGDSNYFQHIAACLMSLSQSNSELKFNVVLLVTKPTQAANDKLNKSLFKCQNISLNIIEFKYENINNLPLAGSYPPEIYARFWIADYFPHSADKVIYLDGDMVIVGSIMPLVAMDMGEMILAAVPIPGSVRTEILGIEAQYGYFNSGVMVINLKKWREIDAKTILLNSTEKLKDKLRDPDQDVLNYCFHKECIRLDFIWNAISPFFKELNSLPLSQDEIKRVQMNVKIVHFNGGSKPWQYLCMHPYAKEYLRCLQLTQWSGFVPNDYNFINILKKLILKLLGDRKTATLVNYYKKLHRL